MKTPYEILEVTENTDNSEIKKAYLDKVRQFPPERFPVAFQEVRQAYELIKSEGDRLSHRLFHCRLPEPVEIAAVILKRSLTKRMPTGKEFQKTLAQDLRAYCVELKIP